ncbi:MAG: PA14 domain-containing protein, partial [Bryobacteraceae bacterium]
MTVHAQGLSAEYFLDSNGSHFQGQPVTTRLDATLALDFVQTPPANIPSATNFSARWKGKIRPRFSETYLFMTLSDDGIRVTINGQPVIDNMSYHPPTWEWNWISLEANKDYDILIEYFQGGGDSQFQLWWQSQSQAKEVVPASQLSPAVTTSTGSLSDGRGLSAEYFVDNGGSHFQGQAIMTRVDSTLNFDYVKTPPEKIPVATNFSARWKGKIRPRFSETYLFTTLSDDGVRVIINNQDLIDNMSYHAPTWNSNSITLQANKDYDIEIDYFQGIGDSQIQLWWQSSSQGKEIVPSSQLFPASATSNGAATYYLDPNGSDSNSGLSPVAPWATTARVNAQPLNPGDRVLFARNGRFNGALRPMGSGTADASITIGAYGSGALPAIDGGGEQEALRLFNQEYWVIDSLDLTGGRQYGVFVSGDAMYRVLHSIHLSNLQVHDIYSTPRWDCGLVMVAPIGDHLTFDDVLVDKVLAYNTNLWYGIHVGFNLWFGNDLNPPLTTNVVIRNSVVHHVYGDGITAAQSQNVLIEKNVVFETGLAPSGVSYTPNGIWTWQCDHTIIQYNEGYATHSFAWDGGVFDIDFGSTNTTIQYNYAHDAEGYCVAVMASHHLITSNSIVRYNICSNNGRKASQAPNQGDVFVTTWDDGSIDGIQIYNNTDYWNPAVDAPWIKARFVSFTGSQPRFIMNNILYSTSHLLVEMDDVIPIDRNLYWLANSGVPTWHYGWGDAHSIDDVRNWRGQELNGMFADPMLQSPTYSGIGRPTDAFMLNGNS